jgi:hypothetical protein
VTPVHLFEGPFLENPDAGSGHLDEGRHGVRGAQVRLDISKKINNICNNIPKISEEKCSNSKM